MNSDDGMYDTAAREEDTQMTNYGEFDELMAGVAPRLPARHECDCGAVYTSVASVLACQASHHGEGPTGETDEEVFDRVLHDLSALEERDRGDLLVLVETHLDTLWKNIKLSRLTRAGGDPKLAG